MTHNVWVKDMEIHAKRNRMDNDINGNPRYYIAKYMLPSLSDVTRSNLGLVKYRGKKYGPGYVLQSYALDYDLKTIHDYLVTQFSEIRNV